MTKHFCIIFLGAVSGILSAMDHQDREEVKRVRLTPHSGALQSGFSARRAAHERASKELYGFIQDTIIELSNLARLVPLAPQLLEQRKTTMIAFLGSLSSCASLTDIGNHLLDYPQDYEKMMRECAAIKQAFEDIIRETHDYSG